MTLHGHAKESLRQQVEKIERLISEKQAIADDLKDIKAETKALGFDLKAIEKIIKLRAKSKDERDEEQAILETYMAALDMIDLFDPIREAAE
tara:strand:+ start:603 stop:878 length:276 start_codon:yes stop_codon:yes gene_type:complete